MPIKKELMPKAKIKRKVNKRINENKKSHPSKMITRTNTERNVINNKTLKGERK